MPWYIHNCYHFYNWQIAIYFTSILTLANLKRIPFLLYLDLHMRFKFSFSVQAIPWFFLALHIMSYTHEYNKCDSMHPKHLKAFLLIVQVSKGQLSKTIYQT